MWRISLIRGERRSAISEVKSIPIPTPGAASSLLPRQAGYGLSRRCKPPIIAPPLDALHETLPYFQEGPMILVPMHVQNIAGFALVCRASSPNTRFFTQHVPIPREYCPLRPRFFQYTGITVLGRRRTINSRKFENLSCGARLTIVEATSRISIREMYLSLLLSTYYPGNRNRRF